MWKTSCPTEWGKPAICCAASSTERSSAQALGSACAPLPWSSSPRARCDCVGILSLSSCEVLLLQNPPVMHFMPRNQIGNRPHCDFILIGNPAPRPRRLLQIPQQGNCRAPHRDVIFNRVGDRTARKRTIPNIVILLEAFDGGSVAARNAQRTVGENALGIADVAQHFFRAPFLGRVAEVAIRLVKSREQLHHLPPLLVERAENIVILNQRYIAIIVRRIFAGLRPGDYEVGSGGFFTGNYRFLKHG